MVFTFSFVPFGFSSFLATSLDIVGLSSLLVYLKRSPHEEPVQYDYDMAIRRRKKFLPAVFFALLSWSIVAFFLFFVDPEIIRDFPISGSYLPFFIFLFLSVFLTASLLLTHARRGLLVSIGITTFLYLRLLGLGHVLNAILLASFLLVLEFALRRN